MTEQEQLQVDHMVALLTEMELPGPITQVGLKAPGNEPMH